MIQPENMPDSVEEFLSLLGVSPEQQFVLEQNDPGRPPACDIVIFLCLFAFSLITCFDLLLVCLTSTLHVVMCPFPHLCQLLFFSMRNLQNTIRRQSYKCFSVYETFGTVYSQQRGFLILLIEFKVFIWYSCFLSQTMHRV